MKRLVLTIVMVLASAGFAGSAGPAQAASGYCTNDRGVTVVVDYKGLGGGVVVRCAVNYSGDGLGALRAAGFSTEGTAANPAAFVCRINGKPAAAQEDCQATPAAGKNWRYFHAANGGSWQISQSGAGNRRASEGGFEGWAFGSGSPGASPQRSGSGSGSGGGSGSASGSGAGTDGSGGSGSDASGGGDDASGDAPSSSEDDSLPKPKPRDTKTAEPPAAGAASDAPDDEVDSEAAAAESESGSATPWIAAGILLALLAGIGIAQWQRRRRHTP